MKGILGRKVGMTQVFTKDGKLIPVTVVACEPNVVMQVKTVEKDGYNAIQLGVFEKKESKSNKAELGHAKKANTTPKRFLKEIKDVEATYNIGDKIDASIFEVGEIVDVTGTTKGKGTQGVIKRHNQSRGPMGHGSHYHRGPGSLGTMLPKRVLKGKKLPGHMGVETVTIQNLEIIEVNTVDNYILVSGNIPGAKNSLVYIKTSVKNSRKKDAKEILSYEEVETVVDSVEEVKEEAPVEEVENTPAEEETTETISEQTEETPVEEATEVTEPTEEETKEENPEEANN